MMAANANASPASISWNAINWKSIDEQVKQLQTRIAKAIREGKHRKAKSLQWLLTHSYSAKLLAIKRVTLSKGEKIPY
jgi:RNA-directed DNA polymerase